MKLNWMVSTTVIVGAAALQALAQDPTPTENLAAATTSGFDYIRVLRAVGSTIGYSFLGIIMSIVGFKLFDMATPFHLEKEIVEDRNLAVAIVSAAMILGVSLIVAFTISS